MFQGSFWWCLLVAIVLWIFWILLCIHIHGENCNVSTVTTTTYRKCCLLWQMDGKLCLCCYHDSWQEFFPWDRFFKLPCKPRRLSYWIRDVWFLLASDDPTLLASVYSPNRACCLTPYLATSKNSCHASVHRPFSTVRVPNELKHL